MAASAQLEILGLAELRKLLKDPKLIDIPARDYLDGMAENVRARARINAPTGVSGGAGLRGSITVDKGGAAGIVRGVRSLTRRVGSNLPYAKPVEFGSRPHWPPRGSLARWAQLKLGATNPMQADFLIRRKISKVGTPAQPFLNPAVRDMERQTLPGLSRKFLNAIGLRFEKGGRR